MKRLSLAKPHLIVMVGVVGSGKSFFAEKFAATFGSPYIHEEKIAGLAPDGKVNEIALLQLDELLKTKQSIIFDGSSETRAERMALAKKAREAGYDILYIWVQTDLATAKARALHAKKPADFFDKAIKRFTSPNTSEKALVISGKHTYASQAKVVLKKLSAPRVESPAQPAIPARPQRPQPRSIIIR